MGRLEHLHIFRVNCFHPRCDCHSQANEKEQQGQGQLSVGVDKISRVIATGPLIINKQQIRIRSVVLPVLAIYCYFFE